MPTGPARRVSSRTATTLTFDDTAAVTTVTLGSPVSPGSITVNNSTTTFTFASSGGRIFGAAPLTKQGTGTLAMIGEAYVGSATVNDGTLLIGAGGMVFTQSTLIGQAAASSGALLVSDAAR